MLNNAHKYTDYVHKIYDLHEYRLLTHTFPSITVLEDEDPIPYERPQGAVIKSI